MTQVGAFKIENGELFGPAEFVRSPEFANTIAAVRRGEDPCGAFRYSPDAETALLVTLQTEFAAWAGQREFDAMREVAR